MYYLTAPFGQELGMASLGLPCGVSQTFDHSVSWGWGVIGGRGCLPNSCSCWQDLFPYIYGTHGALLLQGQQQSVSAFLTLF